MESPELQQQFFNHLKNEMPPHISMVDELSNILNLSSDSVYRRIRGEKPVTLNELKTLCEHFHVSLDHVMALKNDSVVFRAPDINEAGIDLPEFLRGMLSQVKYFNSFSKRRLLYLCKDLPIFHFYLFPEIAAFKSFFWVKTVLNQNEFGKKSFSLKNHGQEECFQLGQEILKEYNLIASTELWNLESINSTISQIEYYQDANIFNSKEDFFAVLDSFENMIMHLQMQAEKGQKFMPGATDVSFKAPLQFFINEVLLGNNTVMVELDDKKLSFVTYNVISYLISKDPRFNEKAFQNFNTLLSRSTMISGVGERERIKFFNLLKDRISRLRNKFQ